MKFTKITPADLEPIWKRELESYRLKRDVIGAIRLCFMNNIPPPPWAKRIFLRATDDWQFKRVEERGLAFGPGPRKYMRVKASPFDQTDAVYRDMCAARASGKTINDPLFDAVAKKLKLHRDTVKRYWRVAREVREGLPPPAPKQAKRKPATKAPSALDKWAGNVPPRRKR